MNIVVGSDIHLFCVDTPFGSKLCEKQALPRGPILLKHVVVGAAGFGQDSLRVPGIVPGIGLFSPSACQLPQTQ